MLRCLFASYLLLPGNATAEPLPIVASFSILADLTKQVGGDRVQIHTLVGPGSDAHVYQPTPSDARTLARARMVIVNGLGFEGWIERLVKSSGYRGKLIVASQGISPLHQTRTRPDQHDAHDGDLDPHAWQDASNAARYVDNIAQALAEADPASRPLYQANATRLKREIADADKEIRTGFRNIPAEQRKVVTSHDAFGYFGRAYGIRFIAPVGANTDAEPTAADVAAIIRQIRREKVRAIFVENSIDPRLLERISRESGARIGGALYSDSLAPPGTPAGTYVGMMRLNARTLASALAD
ncbi:MAG: metal ABC transporter substrate-binding protein [Candidatus Accumulibacter sp.]|nr:metal ABC transporter substrate-binding protein [Accumulibacter sp.]